MTSSFSSFKIASILTPRASTMLAASNTSSAPGFDLFSSGELLNSGDDDEEVIGLSFRFGGIKILHFRI